MLSLLKNNYRYRFIVYRFVITVKKQLLLLFYRFIALAVNFLKNFIIYRLSLPQTFLIVLSLSQVRKLVITESMVHYIGMFYMLFAPINKHHI